MIHLILHPLLSLFMGTAIVSDIARREHAEDERRRRANPRPVRRVPNAAEIEAYARRIEELNRRVVVTCPCGRKVWADASGRPTAHLH